MNKSSGTPRKTSGKKGAVMESHQHLLPLTGEYKYDPPKRLLRPKRIRKEGAEIYVSMNGLHWSYDDHVAPHWVIFNPKGRGKKTCMCVGVDGAIW